MAADDVISKFETAVGNNARLAIQPASGDEWLLTHFGIDYSSSSWLMTSHTNTDEWAAGVVGGVTAVANDFLYHGITTIYTFLLTNGEHIRVKNASGSTGNLGYSAIKTKD
jgi:hypothetical protein